MRELGQEQRETCLFRSAESANRTWREAQKIVSDTINRELL